MTSKSSPGVRGAAEAIRLLRRRASVSARALSAKAGLSPAYVGKVEAGLIDPSLRAFAHIAVALEMTPQEIWWVVMAESQRDRVTVSPDVYGGEQTFEGGEA